MKVKVHTYRYDNIGREVYLFIEDESQEQYAIYLKHPINDARQIIKALRDFIDKESMSNDKS